MTEPLPLSRRSFVGAAAAALSLPLVPDLERARRTLEALPVSALDARAQDADLMEVTIPKLRDLYTAKKYTPTQVTQWYLARIAHYNGVYRALSRVDTRGALATASALDGELAAGRPDFQRRPLWGVPIVIKANTCVRGLVTNVGFWGYVLPGLELVAPKDAPVVAKLKAAGAIILGLTNMPDFAAADTTISTAYGRTCNAYDWRYSPGGSSGGTVMAVSGNLCVLGTGTDTGNSIRTPASTCSLVGVLPTRGLTSISGIHPLDWLRDNTGPIARTVTDAAIALSVMAGPDPTDFRTKESASKAQPGPYDRYLSKDALKGKRLGVPAFMMQESAEGASMGPVAPLRPETHALFLTSLEGLRAAGATVVMDDELLPESFLELVRKIETYPYRTEGTETFLRDYGPAAYHSIAEWERAVGAPLPPSGGGIRPDAPPLPPPVEQDPRAQARLWGPQRAAVAAYEEALTRFHLEGLVYPAAQMPPNDELIPTLQGKRSEGVHSATAWVNLVATPAIVVPGGFYDNGLPFGLELGTARWRDGDLLGWAYAYEQATEHRRQPRLVTSRGTGNIGAPGTR